MTEPVVTVTHGKLRGNTVNSVLGPSYFSFKGIPFAAPPVGKLRFKDPEPVAPWTGVRDATQNAGDICPQSVDYPPFGIFGDEDCLYLNVYTTSLTQRKPVMFWVHGGGFVSGSGVDSFTRPDYLVTKDVVLVSPNYRLGAFGFLNLGHEVAPGNQGLKDLIAALNWVKENISQFGGDPNNVTIFGVSAGGALVHALAISPVAKGLFHRAILQSGTMTCYWSKGHSRPENGFRLASLLGLESTDPEEVVAFLQTIPAKQIVEKQGEIIPPAGRQAFHVAFGVNTDDKAKNPVLPLPMDDLLANVVDVPLIIGYTSYEFLMFFKENSEAVIKHFNEFLPVHVKNLAIATDLDPAQNDRLLQRVVDIYFGGKPISDDNIASLIKLMTDIYFTISTNKLVDELRKKKSTPVYLYNFSFVGDERTLTDLLVPNPVVSGASHADELSYLFYIPRCKTVNPEPPAIGTKDRKTLERVTRMWSNFAKTGNPTSSLDEYIDTVWKPTTKNEFNYLDIGDDLKLSTVQPDVMSTL